MISISKGQFLCLVAAVVVSVIGAGCLWANVSASLPTQVGQPLAPTPAMFPVPAVALSPDEDMEQLVEYVGTPKWDASCGWTNKKQFHDFGTKTAMTPKYLCLDWNDVQNATKYEVYQAYSPAHFKNDNIHYQKIATTQGSHYLSSASTSSHEWPSQYQKLGYYRFKVGAVSNRKIKGTLSSFLEIELQMKKPFQQVRPLWVDNPCWNAKSYKNHTGPTRSTAPQNLWLDWLDVDEATSYRILSAYSPTPFVAGKENYQLMVTPKISAYHSADPRYLTGASQKFTKTGYYRFKVEAVSALGKRSKVSDYRELVLQ